MSLERIKKTTKKIPGLSSAYWKFKGLCRGMKVSSSGVYLFDDKKISWIHDSLHKQSLPFLYRSYASCCNFIKTNDEARNLRYRKLLFSSVSRVTKRLNLQNAVVLDLNGHKVCIDLLDPRCFKAASEVLNNANRLENLLVQGDTFIDVGANHGAYSILASKIVGASGHIIAVEPQPRLAALLENSLSLNNNCTYEIHKFACGDFDGSSEFYVPHHNSGEAGLYSSFSATNEHSSITVDIKRFDDAVDWNDLPGNILLKLDIEGSEYAFIKGAKEFLTARKPVIMMEVNEKSLKSAGVSKEDLVSIFNYVGYEAYQELDGLSATSLLADCDMSFHRIIIVLPR